MLTILANSLFVAALSDRGARRTAVADLRLQSRTGTRPNGREQRGGLGLLAERLTRVLRRLSDDRVVQRAEAALASMDDHLLRDIGVTRGDVARRVREGRR